mgnify:CR=1 FL=1
MKKCKIEWILTPVPEDLYSMTMALMTHKKEHPGAADEINT